MPGIVAGRGGRLPAGDAGDWTGDAAHWNRDDREQPGWDWPARPQAPQDQPVREPAASGEPAASREADRISPAFRLRQPRGSGEAVPGSMPPPERAAAGLRRQPPLSARLMCVPPMCVLPMCVRLMHIRPIERPADDPTRLARRLGSAAELSRQAGPDAAIPARSPGGAPGRQCTGRSVRGREPG